MFYSNYFHLKTFSYNKYLSLKYYKKTANY